MLDNYNSLMFVGDSTIYALRRRFPTMLAYYQNSDEWRRNPDRCGWSAPEGARDYFQDVNGPWPS